MNPHAMALTVPQEREVQRLRFDVEGAASTEAGGTPALPGSAAPDIARLPQEPAPMPALTPLEYNCPSSKPSQRFDAFLGRLCGLLK